MDNDYSKGYSGTRKPEGSRPRTQRVDPETALRYKQQRTEEKPLETPRPPEILQVSVDSSIVRLAVRLAELAEMSLPDYLTQVLEATIRIYGKHQDTRRQYSPEITNQETAKVAVWRDKAPERTTRSRTPDGDQQESNYKRPYKPRSEKPWNKESSSQETGYKKPYTPRTSKPWSKDSAASEGGYKKPYTPRTSKPWSKDSAASEGGYKKPYTPRTSKPWSKDSAAPVSGFKKPYKPRASKPWSKDSAAPASGFKKPYKPGTKKPYKSEGRSSRQRQS